MNKKERREYWRRVERLRRPLERKYARQIKGVFMRQGEAFLAALDQEGLPAVRDYQATLEPWDAGLMQVYMDMHRETFLRMAEATYRNLYRTARVKKDVGIGGMGRSEVWQAQVQDFLRQHGLEKVVTIQGNTRELLLKLAGDAIAQANELGLGANETVKLIRDAIKDKWERYSTYRALRIARTETNTAANMGHMAGAESLPFYVDKVWISAQDNRTRRIDDGDEWDHWVLDGRQVGYDDVFITMSKLGEVLEVEHPGDPDAPAAFVINCRCRVAFEPKRDADGELMLKPTAF